MQFIDEIIDSPRLDSHTWRVEVDDTPRVVRAFRWRIEAGDESPGLHDPFQVALCRVDAVACWTDFLVLSPRHSEALQLGEGRWLLAVRPYIEGQTLASMPARAATEWTRWARQIAIGLRALHAQHWRHGHLHPELVIIDDDAQPHLVGLPLLPDPPHPTSFDGAAPLRAPECWDGEDPSPSSDVYSLATLICWMASGATYPIEAAHEADWARAHREQTPVIPASIPAPLSRILKRCLGTRAELRPQLQSLLDALNDLADGGPAFSALPPSLYRGLEKKVLDRLQQRPRALILRGEPLTGKSFALERIYARLRLSGTRAVLCAASTVRGPGPEQRRTVSKGPAPWDGIRRLIEALDDDDAVPRSEVTGDFLHVFDTWADRLKQALSPGRTVVLWDDFNATGIDVRAFWRHLLDDMDRDENDNSPSLQLVLVTEPDDDWEGPGDEIPVVGPQPGDWKGWRVRTRLAEVRTLAPDQWQQLAEKYGAQPVKLFRALHDALGIDEVPDFARPTRRHFAQRDVSVIFAGDWRRYLDGLVTSGAYWQAVDTCQRLYEVLARSGRTERIDVLRIWVDALMRIGHPPVKVIALERALSETAEPTGPGAQALCLQAKLYFELGWFDEALNALDQLGDAGEDRQIDSLRWRAQILVSAGQLEAAQKTAQQGLKAIETGSSPHDTARHHLAIVRQGAAALAGDREATDSLRTLAARLQHEEIPAPFRARCHLYRAIGLTRHNAWDEATEPYLRALEELESAGLLSQLPPFLLDVATAYRQQGHLGIALEYYARGRRYAHDGTRHSTRALLLVQEARINLLLGRLDAATPLVDEALRLADTEGLAPIAAIAQTVSGDLLRAQHRPEQALTTYRSALDRPDIGPKQRAELCLSGGDAALAIGDRKAASDFADRARQLIEEYEIDRLINRQGLLRARLQWSGGTALDAMGATERFRHHLLKACDARDYALVLRETNHLWTRLVDEDHRELMREIAREFHAAKTAVSIGLSPSSRQALDDHLPQIPHPDQLDQHADMPDPSHLVESNEALRRSLQAKHHEIETLKTRIAELEAQLAQASQSERDDTSQSRRGRKPKATRQQVTQAMERFDGDYDAMAACLNVSTRTVYRYVKKFGLDH